MRNHLLYLLLSLMGFSVCVQGNGKIGTGKTETKMKLIITIGEKTVTVLMDDNPTSRDFVKLLPSSLSLKDYNNTEKVADLSRKLDIQSAPTGFKPSIGDLTYYAPWGNLAIFYKDFSYSTGLISLGKITGAIDAFKTGGTIAVKIEVLSQPNH